MIGKEANMVFVECILILKVLSKIVADNIQFFLLFFRENKGWHFMQIICFAGDSHEMSSLIFSEWYKKTKKKFFAAVDIST